MIRNFFLSRALVATLAVVAGTSGLALAQMSSMTAMTGDWAVTSTGDNFNKGTVHLQQQGSTIVGNFTGTPHSAQVSGKLTNQTLSGTWKQSGGESGWLTLFFSEDGTGFRGEWGYHGRPPNGQLVGTKNKM